MFKLTDISVILLFTTGINVFSAYSSWRRWKTNGSIFITLGMLGLSIWTLAAALEYAVFSIDLKLLFTKFEAVGYNGALVMFTVFVLIFTGHEDLLKSAWLKVLLILLPASNIIMTWTNDIHGLLWTGITRIEPDSYLVVFHHGPAFTWVAITCFSMLGVILLGLLQASFRGSALARRQARLLLIISLLPLLSNLLHLIDIPELKGINLTSLTFSVSGLLYLWALYVEHFLDIIPVARDSTIERMTDCILVLDPQNYLVDFNSAARDTFGINSNQVGNQINEVLPDWHKLLDLVALPDNDDSPKTLIHEHGAGVFDTRLTTLEDERGRLYGKLVVSRDITDRHDIEKALTERIKELKCIYDLTLLVETPDTSLHEILQGSVELISAAMRYPELAYARILLGDQSFATTNYQDTDQKLSHDVSVHGRSMGVMELGYLKGEENQEAPVFSEEEKRLLYIMADRLGDMIQAMQTEKELRLNEERYRTVADYTYDWEYWRAPDGSLLYMSPSCARITGYQADEFIENPGLLEDIVLPDDKPLIDQHKAERMKDHAREPKHEVEFRVRRRDGEMRWIGHTCQNIVKSDGSNLGLRATNRDITENKQRDEIERIRLGLWEYAASHAMDELMQHVLDKVCNLLDSPIGFYHLVDENQENLSLQAWSTRTTQEFCKAEGKGMHYPISEAGVWVDCIRQGKPVIHNDYASLPHRQGLPPGHAEVIRELVVPTFENKKIVSVLGIGNRNSEYSQKDIELVSQIASFVWRIVEKKRADEQIRQLNTRLEDMAMTDDLTGLENRRAFAQRGGEEIRRARRYHDPLSLLMVDIDHFKRINDTYGHEAGDQMLRCIADVLRAQLRDVDMLARLGGEEFGVLMPNTNAENAVKLAERLREAVSDISCPIENIKVPVTLSIGVAAYSKNIEDIYQFLKEADTAMYKAKAQGRNRVVFLL